MGGRSWRRAWAGTPGTPVRRQRQGADVAGGFSSWGRLQNVASVFMTWGRRTRSRQVMPAPVPFPAEVSQPHCTPLMLSAALSSPRRGGEASHRVIWAASSRPVPGDTAPPPPRPAAARGRQLLSLQRASLRAQRGLRKPPTLLETFRNRVFTAWVGRGGHEDTDEPTCLAQKHFGWETHPVGALGTTPQPAPGAWVSPRTPKHQGPHGPRLLLPGTPGLGPCQQRPAGSLLPFVAPCHTPELYETSSGFVDFEFPRLRQAGSNLP